MDEKYSNGVRERKASAGSFLASDAVPPALKGEAPDAAAADACSGGERSASETHFYLYINT